MKVGFVNLVVFISLVFAAFAANASDPKMPTHEHKMVQIPEGKSLPELHLEITRDTKSGFNIEIQTKYYSLEPPEKAGTADSSILEGHAHIFVNGKKVYRAYAPYMHLPEELFESGVNQIMVSLNDHDHNTWSKGPRMVMSTIVVDTTQTHFLKHSFDAYPFALVNAPQT